MQTIVANSLRLKNEKIFVPVFHETDSTIREIKRKLQVIEHARKLIDKLSEDK